MSKQPEALRLADALEDGLEQYDGYALPPSSQDIADAAAAELRHLHAVNVKLLEALKGIVAIVDDSRGVAGYHLNGDTAEWDEFDEVDAANAAITKAEAA